MTGWGPKTGSASGGGGGGDQGNPDIVDHVINVYNDVLLVPANVETNIINYVVPASLMQIVRAEFGGTNIGKYRFYIDNVCKAQYVTWFNGPMDGTWNFDAGGKGEDLLSGQVIKVTAEHGRPFVGDYWVKLTFIKIDA